LGLSGLCHLPYLLPLCALYDQLPRSDQLRRLYLVFLWHLSVQQFLSHQLGSFAGLWLAGRLYDVTHSYDVMWWICAGLGLLAAVLNFPIRERPVARIAMAPAE